MKKLQHNVSRTGDHVKVNAAWVSKMRTPVAVHIVDEKQAIHSDSLLIEGDAGEVQTTLNGLAEIAWDMGWRPQGLGPVLAHIVGAYKIPKAE